MFVRIFKHGKEAEILINTNTVWKIEVGYTVPGENDQYWTTTLQSGFESPEAVRSYRIFAGNDEILLLSNPDDPVVRIFEEIYRSAIKAEPKNKPPSH